MKKTTLLLTLAVSFLLPPTAIRAVTVPKASPVSIIELTFDKPVDGIPAINAKE